MPGATGDYFSRLHSETDELDKDKLALTMAEQKRNELQRQLSSEQPLMGGIGIAGPHGRCRRHRQRDPGSPGAPR